MNKKYIAPLTMLAVVALSSIGCDGDTSAQRREQTIANRAEAAARKAEQNAVKDRLAEVTRHWVSFTNQIGRAEGGSSYEMERACARAQKAFEVSFAASEDIPSHQTSLFKQAELAANFKRKFCS